MRKLLKPLTAAALLLGVIGIGCVSTTTLNSAGKGE